MWIMGAVTMVAVLAPGRGSDAMEPTGNAGRLDPLVSYIHAQQVPEPRIWLDRGADPVLEAGDRVRIYYRTPADAYVAILQIDTDGTTRMLYPRSPTENHYARADRDYRLLFQRSAYWNVDDRPGVGYFFVVTSPTPFDLSDFRHSYYDGGWDLSAVGSTVYSDPYVAMDDYVAWLVPDWEYLDYGLDFISYSVGGAHEYPRFLCYQCHGFRPYSAWNPYRYSCVNFRVVVYDDPYFYPSRRYRADRVVMVGPRNPTRPRFGFKERAPGESGTPVVVVRRSPTTTRRRDTSSGDVPRVRPDGGRVTPPPAGDREPAVPRRPTLERRSTPPSQDTRSRPEPARQRPTPTTPRQSPQPDRPSTRRPDKPRAGSSTRAPSTRPSTRPRPAPSNGSSTARSAPRERPRTPLAGRVFTRPPPRRPPGTGTR